MCRPRPRVCRQFALRRGNRLRTTVRTSVLWDRLHRTVARTGRRSSATFAEEALHDASSRLCKVTTAKRPPGRRERSAAATLLELVELGIEMNADGLEGARRRVALLTGRRRRGGRWRPAPRYARQDVRQRWHGQSPGARLLPIVAQDPGNGLVGRIQELGGGHALDFDMRMSSGPSAWNEKPRSARSSCMELTPMISAIAQRGRCRARRGRGPSG